MTHPRDMGPKQVKSYLTMLANERKVSASTHNQALSAPLLLFREKLEMASVGTAQTAKCAGNFNV